jgi:magnesium chelatase family protein
MVEVTAIHSAAGLLGPGHAVITRPPFRAPHHTTTPAAMAGGGQEMRPGEAALAHRGVLFLANAPEFPRAVLGMLRQPLCDGEIIVARGGRIVRFPAAFTLIAGMAPCPCHALADCTCSEAKARRYRGRVSRELGHRIDIWLDLAPGADAGDRPELDRQAIHVSAGRVAAARDRAQHRLAGRPWRLNGDIPATELRRSYLPPPEAMAAVRRAVDLGQISAPMAHRVLRVAWTLADLAGLDHPGQDECSQALALHLGGLR